MSHVEKSIVVRPGTVPGVSGLKVRPTLVSRTSSGNSLYLVHASGDVWSDILSRDYVECALEKHGLRLPNISEALSAMHDNTRVFRCRSFWVDDDSVDLSIGYYTFDKYGVRTRGTKGALANNSIYVLGGPHWNYKLLTVGPGHPTGFFYGADAVLQYTALPPAESIIVLGVPVHCEIVSRRPTLLRTADPHEDAKR